MEVGTALNNNEKRALISFLLLYTLSATFLMVIIGILYYNKELVSIQDKCSIEMRNAALMVKQSLMQAEMEHTPYVFNPPQSMLRIGLFDANASIVHSNLESSKVLLSQEAYKSATHEYHIERLSHSIQNIDYIVVENSQGAKDKFELFVLVATTFCIALLFVACIGYFLSRLLLSPIKKRMEHLNNFIKDSAHEINTPVSALMMSVTTLRNHPEMPTRTLNHISVSAKRIFDIYNSLSFLAFNDHDKVMDEVFDIATTVHEGVKFFEELAAIKGNSFTCKLEQTPVLMDKARAQKLINNLLSNAIKYSYPKTPIVVELENYVFRITNQGDGIAQEDIPFIFARYERKSTLTGGFGIGLDIVKTICSAYGIEVTVESISHQTTSFKLHFPSLKQ